MGSRALIVMVMLTGSEAVLAQSASDHELARLLANYRTRRSAVAEVAASANRNVPLLISWTKEPPPGVDRYQLYVGLADVFAELRTKEALPFLVQYLSLSRTVGYLAPWMKTPASIENNFPMAAALIAIGPDASEPLMRAWWGPMRPEDRLVAIFVITRMLHRKQEIPGARSFLKSALGQADLERRWAQEGLNLLDEHSH